MSRAIIARRNALHISQTELARLSGVSRSTINAIESGQNRKLAVRTLLNLSKPLDLSLDQMFGYAKPCSGTSAQG